MEPCSHHAVALHLAKPLLRLLGKYDDDDEDDDDDDEDDDDDLHDHMTIEAPNNGVVQLTPIAIAFVFQRCSISQTSQVGGKGFLKPLDGRRAAGRLNLVGEV